MNMMGRKAAVIRTPMVVRLRRFAHTVLPGIIFLLCVVAVLSLWQRSVGTIPATGRVEATRVNITAATDGTLLSGNFKPFQQVKAGEILARLDDAPLRAQLESLQGEVVALQKELDSTTVETSLDDADRNHEYLRQMASLTSEVERCRLDIVDRNALIQEDRVELSRLESQLSYMKVVAETKQGLLSNADMDRVTSERNAVEKLMKTHQMALAQAQANYREALKRQEGLPKVHAAAIETLLAPIQASIAAAEARVREVQAQIDTLQVRCPIDGTISAIFYFPGQGVRAGEPIMTIAADAPSHITAYVPPYSTMSIRAGMPVSVRTRSSEAGVFNSTIKSVASQWEPLPLELLRDQKTAQLALAVQIEIPPNVTLRPGELVEVRMEPLPTVR